MKKALLIGGGMGGKALLELFIAHGGVAVACVVDKDETAPGMEFAKVLGIPTAKDYVGILENSKFDIVINATGDMHTSIAIREKIPHNVEVLESFGAKLMWDLVEKQRAAKEKEKEFRREFIQFHTNLKSLSDSLDEKVSTHASELKRIYS